MTIKSLFEELKNEFGLEPIAFYNHIKQNDDFVILTGFDRANVNTKMVNLKVLFVRNTLEREVYKYLDEIAEFEEKILKLEQRFRASILSSMQIQSISESLFAYVFNLQVPLKKVS